MVRIHPRCVRRLSRAGEELPPDNAARVDAERDELVRLFGFVPQSAVF